MSTLTLPGKSERAAALRVVVDNKDFRPAVHHSDFAKRKDFEKIVTVVTNPKYMSPEEKRALGLADYIEKAWHHRQLGEDEGLCYMAVVPAEATSDAARDILRKRGYNVYRARMAGRAGVRYSISRKSA